MSEPTEDSSKWDFGFDNDERRRAIEAEADSRARVAEAQAKTAEAAARWGFHDDERRAAALIVEAESRKAVAQANAAVEKWRTIRHVLMALTVAAIVFGILGATANATDYFPTKEAAQAVAHGKHVSYICTGKDQLWYVGPNKAHTCADHPRTTEREVMPTEADTRRVRTTTKPSDSRPRPAKLAGAAPMPPPRPETTALAPTRVRTIPAPAFTYGTLTDTDRAIAIETTGAAPAQAVALAWPEAPQEPATLYRTSLKNETTVVTREPQTMSGLELLAVFLLALGIPGALTGIPFLPAAFRWWRARSMGAR